MITLTPVPPTESSYNLSWDYQQNHLVEGLKSLFGQDPLALTDVTLACDGEYIHAHKLVLSLCSSFFKDLFTKNPTDKSNTIIILGNVSVRNLRYILQFIYQGNVSIPSRDVDSFLQAGSVLKVEGLVGNAPHFGQTANTEQTQNENNLPFSATAPQSLGVIGSLAAPVTLDIANNPSIFSRQGITAVINQKRAENEISYPSIMTRNDSGIGEDLHLDPGDLQNYPYSDSQPRSPPISPMSLMSSTPYWPATNENSPPNENCTVSGDRVRKGRVCKKSSSVWDHYIIIPTSDIRSEARCKICLCIIGSGSWSTIGLRMHLRRKHNISTS